MIPHVDISRDILLFFSLFLMCAFILQSPEAEVPGLVEGKDYMFRVRAVNSEGESEPLETDAATKAKNPWRTSLCVLDR